MIAARRLIVVLLRLERSSLFRMRHRTGAPSLPGAVLAERHDERAKTAGTSAGAESATRGCSGCKRHRRHGRRPKSAVPNLGDDVGPGAAGHRLTVTAPEVALGTTSQNGRPPPPSSNRRRAEPVPRRTHTDLLRTSHRRSTARGLYPTETVTCSRCRSDAFSRRQTPARRASSREATRASAARARTSAVCSSLPATTWLPPTSNSCNGAGGPNIKAQTGSAMSE